MPASTTDDFLILTVGDDNVDIEHRNDAAGPSMHDPARRLLVGRTQCMPLSAPNTCLRYHHAVRAYGRVKLVTRSVGEWDSSADG